MSRRIGITTTIPVEIVIAASCTPVDLNNLFISSEEPNLYIELAERSNFPKNCCSWIKGIYGVVIKEKIEEVIGVIQGDCSNTKALLETLELAGVRIIPFAYHSSFLKEEIGKLMGYFGVNWRKVIKIKEKLDELREKARYLDNIVCEAPYLPISASEVHSYLVSCSDFFSDIQVYEEKINALLKEVETLTRNNNPTPQPILRIGYIGVPPIVKDLYQFIETNFPAKIVYHELAYQFTMPYISSSLEEVYKHFTYPYSVYSRIEDIKYHIKRRRLQGLIHYVQSFCFRQIEDIVFKHKLNIPILTLECDKPGFLDERSKLRLESFINMLQERSLLASTY